MDETALEFEGPAFTDAALKAIPNLDKVEMLALLDTAVTDRGFSELLRAQALDEVSIVSDTLSDAVLQVLAQLPALRSLQIHRGPRIGDKGVQHLANCVGLRELYLKETAITDHGLMAIGSLHELWSLILDDTAVSDDGCAFLSEMPRLSLLSLNRTRVAGHGMARLRDNAHNIYLEETPATDEGVIALAERLSNLQLLSLNQTSVGDRAARALSKLQQLNDVRFSHTKLTDKGLAAFSGHSHLEVIYVRGCAVTRNMVDALKKASPCELTVYGPDLRSAEVHVSESRTPISSEYLPSELHYLIPLAEQHGSDARVAYFDHSLGRHVQYGEKLSLKDIEPLRQLYAEISSKGHGALINAWHQGHNCKDTCPPETTWPIYGLLCLFQQLGRLGIAPFNDGVIQPHE